ncbi:uncharacterized protein PHACADRAFT_211886 [Phanerochaete carnosa HHB-10118-sp]|uniref:Uncharacterized protein n=1 Tax=Phanerochaete carnosa (strain HHB-10118-sp) TaxID=650164 RepID=K5URY7_PHACS|nr:uncharacterized protein PHACADRAFT_211886 [Phanerochaete carnosa HHB-10118-sp]EKM52661.1 hypothetical protein PHACADRAFT_211886 [Phanerochaete carnosa HHB-10118-sp]
MVVAVAGRVEGEEALRRDWSRGRVFITERAWAVADIAESGLGLQLRTHANSSAKAVTRLKSGSMLGVSRRTDLHWRLSAGTLPPGDGHGGPPASQPGLANASTSPAPNVNMTARQNINSLSAA